MTLQNAQSYAERKEGTGLLTENINMLSVGTQLTLDSRNSSLIPLSGSYTNLRYALTPILLDHSAPLWQLSATHEENIKLGEQTTLQLAGVIGLSSSSMPLSEKFFLGGMGSTYSQRFIGLKENDLPGNNIAVAGVHFRYKPSFTLLFPTSLLLHYNTGNVWEERKTISFNGLIHGAGTSLLWETPIGPANLTISKAFAFLENAKNTGSSSLRFSDTIYYFSLGHDF
jgi:NTE family protein